MQRIDRTAVGVAPQPQVHGLEFGLGHEVREFGLFDGRPKQQLSRQRSARRVGARGARLVLVKAPKALDALREVAEVVAAAAAPDVTVLVGGRVKHMTQAMNEVLRDSFGEVSATLARQKPQL